MVYQRIKELLFFDNATATREQIHQKIVFLVTTVSALVPLPVLPQMIERASHDVYNVVGYFGILFAMTGSSVCALLGFHVNPVYVSVVTFTCIVLQDFSFNAVGQEYWSTFVLVFDFLLVTRSNHRATMCIVCSAVVWLLILALEHSFRFGLLDAPLLPSQYGEYSRHEALAKLGECEALPCALGLEGAVYKNMRGVFILLVDFVATRGFAEQVRKEQDAMEYTIDKMQEIASLLAAYDVDSVARVLQAEDTLLPTKMHATLKKMEQNLRRYRPYLPAALFEGVHEADAVSPLHTPVAPPGACGEATVVFTDIRSSTHIWEIAPEGMRAGLRIHNAVLREAMHVFGGYEVKTIGDAFMVAFETTRDGVSFGLNVHELLREADWPASLLENAPICAEQGTLWGGLTVRIGINSGPVSVETNTLTGRQDYFGNTVNVAARLESICTPGAVAMRADLWAEHSCAAAVAGDVVPLDLKGLSGNTSVCFLWPLSLGGRKHTPLRETYSMGDAVNDCASSRAMSFASVLSSSHSVTSGPHTRQVMGTVGIAELSIGTEGSTSMLARVSYGISALTVALDQSGGILVSLLGTYACIGWNLTRTTPTHIENAVRFAQRVLRGVSLRGLGLATGPLHHGDVGARKHRFVIVLGHSVRRSWALCEDAVRDERGCFYEPPPGTVFPSAMEGLVTPDCREGIYRVVLLASRDQVL